MYKYIYQSPRTCCGESAQTLSISHGGKVYGPYPSFYSSGVSVSVRSAAGRLLWWGGGVGCFVGVNLSSPA